MPKLVVQRGPEPGRALELRHGLNTVGRADTNDFAIDDASISAHHCVLAVQAGNVVVRDLDSTNGTFIDDRLIRETCLNPGQTLRLGDVELAWECEAVAVSVPEIPPPSVTTEQSMPDGTPCCLKHPGVPAVWECGRCQHHYCGPCIHRLGRVGGRVHNFCPVCSGECQWIGPQREKKAGLFGSIKKAVRSVFKK